MYVYIMSRLRFESMLEYGLTHIQIELTLKIAFLLSSWTSTWNIKI